MRKAVRACLIPGALLLGLLPAVAWGDNCGTLADCFSTARAAIAAAVGVGLFGVLVSFGLDLIPGVGTVKGIIESITGRDLVTNQELAWWERLLGVVPYGRAAEAAIKGAGAAVAVGKGLGAAGVFGKGGEEVVVAVFRKGKREAGDVGDAARTVEATFVEAVRQRAVHTIETSSNRERGPVLTGVFDTRTGRTFFGTNQKDEPLDLHPLLAERLAGYLSETRGVTPERAGKPGTHSEIVALNRALHEREAMLGRPVEPQELSEFVLHNRSLRGSTKVEGIPPPCPNCEAILPPGIRILP